MGGIFDAFTAFLVVLIVSDHDRDGKGFSDNQKWIFSLSAIFAGLYYALISTVAISVTEGLETGLYTFVIALTFRLLQIKRLEYAAFVSAIAVLLRPDGLILVLVVLVFLFWTERRIPWRAMVIMGTVLTPYVLFSFYYFGNLLPQTIIAKGLTARSALEQWVIFLDKFFLGGSSVGISGLFCLIGLYIIIKSRQDLLPLLFWTTAYVAGFSTFAAWWPWYFPPVLIGYCVAVGFGLGAIISYLNRQRIAIGGWQLVDFVGRQKELNWISFIMALGLAAALLTQLYRNSPSLDRTSFVSKQRIELANWVNANTPVDVSVMVEPLGMIAYYTDRRFDDYPGLASRRVTDAIKQFDRQIGGRPVDYQAFGFILDKVDPDFIILRQDEYEINKACGSLESYQVVYISPIPPEVTSRYRDLQTMIILAHNTHSNIISPEDSYVLGKIS